mmetsp:Transcript_21212/g.50306  ORF Transcript_21212/g.50306 Transcript_21212/m.50306 type:complete len:254 (-) Transcript_21212:129-890(-)
MCLLGRTTVGVRACLVGAHRLAAFLSTDLHKLFNKVTAGWSAAAVRKVESVLQTSANVSVELSCASQEGPHLSPPNRNRLPVRARNHLADEEWEPVGVGGHSACNAHDEGDVNRGGEDADLLVHVDAAHDARIETLAFRDDVSLLHGLKHRCDLAHRVVEEHRFPSPFPRLGRLEIVQGAAVEGCHVWLALVQTGNRPASWSQLSTTRRPLVPNSPSGHVDDDDSRNVLADGTTAVQGDLDKPFDDASSRPHH